jgi:hypothetical protein
MKLLYIPLPSRHIGYQGLIWLTSTIYKFLFTNDLITFATAVVKKCFKVTSEEKGNEMLWSEANIA